MIIDDCAFGLISTSLVKNQQSEETGFMFATSPESILETLREHKLYPATNKLCVKAYASELTDEERAEFLGEEYVPPKEHSPDEEHASPDGNNCPF